MIARYSEAVKKIQTLPKLWLLSDERNDAALEVSLRALPRGSGLIFRHYHLDERQRWSRFRTIRRLALARGHTVVLADSALTAREWGASGVYGPPRSLYPSRAGLLHLATAHTLHEIGQAQRFGADAVLLSPVYPTNSHPGGQTLGAVRFRMLAQSARLPVIALGGMTVEHARTLNWSLWAAIDGLS